MRTCLPVRTPFRVHADLKYAEDRRKAVEAELVGDGAFHLVVCLQPNMGACHSCTCAQQHPCARRCWGVSTRALCP